MIPGDKLVTFEGYYDPMLAEIIRTRLMAGGISCSIADNINLQIVPYHNQLLGGVKLKVFEKDLERCREILAAEILPGEPEDRDIENELRSATVCPHCSSANVRYGTATAFKFHFPSVLVSIFFGVPCYFRNVWHCFNCHREF